MNIDDEIDQVSYKHIEDALALKAMKDVVRCDKLRGAVNKL